MLTPETWSALVQAQDFDALLSVPSKTVYAPYFQIEHQELTPRRAVYQIRWHLADVYEKLIRLTPEPGQQLLLQLWRLYEVDNLKATLRGVETGASWDQVRHLLYPMTKYITLTTANMEKMIRSGCPCPQRCWAASLMAWARPLTEARSRWPSTGPTSTASQSTPPPASTPRLYSDRHLGH